MFEQRQSQSKETQVTTVGAMDDFHPVIPFGDDSQVDEPNVCQTGRDHQPSQALWVRDVAFVQVEPSALLVGEEGLNSESSCIPSAGFLDQFHVGDQVDRFFAAFLPPDNGQDWPISPLGEEHVKETEAISWLSVKRKGQACLACPF